MKTFNWMPVFKVGRFIPLSGKAFDATKEVIEKITTATKSLKDKKIPFVLNHPVQEEGTFSFGQFDCNDVRLNGDMIEIKPEKIDDSFAEAFNKGQFKGVSIKIGRDYAIKHLGFLTDKKPAVDLPEYAFASGEEDGDEEFNLEEMFADGRVTMIGTLFQNLRDKMIEDEGLEAADRFYPSWILDELKQWRPEIPEWLMDTINALQGKNSTDIVNYFSQPDSHEDDMPTIEELQRQLAEANAEKVRLAQENSELTSAQKRSGFEAFCSGDDMKKRIPPTMRDEAVDVLMAADQVGDVAFSEGTVSFSEKLKGFLKKLPEQVSFSSVMGDEPDPAKETSVGEDAADAYNKSRGLK